MVKFNSQLSKISDTFSKNRAEMLALIERTQMLEERAAQASANAKPRFDKRGQILPHDRVARLLDPGAPFLEIGNMAERCTRIRLVLLECKR